MTDAQDHIQTRIEDLQQRVDGLSKRLVPLLPVVRQFNVLQADFLRLLGELQGLMDQAAKSQSNIVQLTSRRQKIDISEKSSAERRNAKRIMFNGEARLDVGGGGVPVIVGDISAFGMRLMTSCALPPGSTVVVDLGAGPLASQIVWRTDQEVGMRFLQPMAVGHLPN